MEVELVGDLPGYHESVAEPAIAVSATERADTADWFDLHVEVTVEGERVPFDQLFVALSQGEEHLVLESGVWFSLHRPGLDRLRDLIEESRSLDDRDPARCRSTASRSRSGRTSSTSASSPRRPRAGRRAVRGLVGSEPAPSPGRCRRRCWPSCGRTSARASPGCTRSGRTGSAGSSPTTWASARPCRPWRWSPRPGSSRRPGGARRPGARRSSSSRPTSVVPGWVGEAARFVPSLRVVTSTRGPGGGARWPSSPPAPTWS